MIDKPKRTIEEIGRRRKQMDKIRVYLILMILLVGTPLLGKSPDPIGPLAFIMAFPLAMTIAFIVYVFPDQSPNGDDPLGCISIFVLGGGLLFALTLSFLERLLG